MTDSTTPGKATSSKTTVSKVTVTESVDVVAHDLGAPFAPDETVLELQGETPDVEAHELAGSCFSIASIAIGN
jgi:hypothetical protein